MTAEGSTGAPLRQQIAEAIARGVAEKYTSAEGARNPAWDIEQPDGPDNEYHFTTPMEQRVQRSPAIVAPAADGYLSISHPTCVEIAEAAADAVVALLNLTEEHALTFAPDMPPAVMERRIADALSTSERPLLVRYVTPWLPSTPPDTTSSEPA